MWSIFRNVSNACECTKTLINQINRVARKVKYFNLSSYYVRLLCDDCHMSILIYWSEL